MYGNFFAPYTQPYAQQTYQPQYQQPTQMSVANQSTDDRIFVASEAAAEAYLVTAGGFVRLWDSSKPFYYEKSADMSGRQFPMKKFRYEEYHSQEQNPTMPDYEARLKAIEDRLTACENRKSKRKVVEVNDDE